MSFLHLGVPSSGQWQGLSIQANTKHFGEAVLWAGGIAPPMFSQTDTLSQVLSGSRSNTSGYSNIQFYWAILLQSYTFSCWHSAAWGLLELEVTCPPLHLNKSFFGDCFLTPFLTRLYVWPQHWPVEMSSVIQLRAVWSIIPFCLRPSVCLFLLVLPRNIECSVLGLDAYLVECLDLCNIPSSVTFFQEGDSKWNSVVWTMMCHLRCQRVFETVVERYRSDTRTCRRPMLFRTAARDQAEYAKCLKWQLLAI